MTVTLVAAVAANGGIGRDGSLPWWLPEDLRRFKALTMGHVLVMGRRTYDSIGRALPGRTTVVVTRDVSWQREGVLTAAGVQEALALARSLDDEIFVIGGSEVFAEALSAADRMVIAHVDGEPDCDTYFPAVDWSKWREVDREPGEGFETATYVRDGSTPGVRAERTS